MGRGEHQEVDRVNSGGCWIAAGIIYGDLKSDSSKDPRRPGEHD